LIINLFKVDDAVGATCVHGFGGFWGMIAVGLFAREDKIAGGFYQYEGFVWNGETYLHSIQLPAATLLTIWAMSCTSVILD
jgi:Amt family ammonium transporter